MNDDELPRTGDGRHSWLLGPVPEDEHRARVRAVTVAALVCLVLIGLGAVGVAVYLSV